MATMPVLFFLQLKAQTDTTYKGLVFRNLTYEEALKVSAKENKMVFLHGYAEWCHYCKDMIEKVYPDSEVGAFYNANFINIHMDLEKEGAELNKRLLSHTFPTLVFFDSKGTVMHRAVGRHVKQLMLQLGQEALDPRRRLYTWQQLYNEGNCSTDTAYIYLRKLEIANFNLQQEALKYLTKQKPEDLKSAANWKIINDIYRDVSAPFMLTLIRLKPDFETLYTKPIVDKKFMDIYKYEFAIRTRTLDTAGYDNLKKQVKESGLDLADQIVDYADLQKAKMKGDYELYFKLGEAYAKKHAANDGVLLNEIAQVFYEKTKDPVLLSKAEAMARKSVELNDCYTYNETLAGILILQEKKEDARTVTNHAIEVGIKTKVNYKKAQIYLEKIDEMK